MPAPEDTRSSAGRPRTSAPALPRPPRRGAARPSTAAPAAPTYADRPWLASYPDGVPADYDFPSVPLTRLLDDAASSFPTRTALAFLGTTLTYRELTAAVDAFASSLRALGVSKGDRVAIVLPNCPQNVIAFFATLRLGAIVVQHNPLYTQAELRHQLADCGATVVVCLDRVYETVARVRADTALEHVVVTSIADYLPRAARLKLRLPLKKAKRARAEITAQLPKGAPVRQFVAMLKNAEPARQVEVDPENDLALLQYTGGTTGLSKGAMLTHHNLVSNAYMNRLWDTGATAGKEVTLGVLPLFHAYGLTVCMNATVLLGGTLVLLPRFDLDQVFAAIDQYRPTMFPGVPPIYKAITDSPRARSHDLRSIRLCVSGAMKLPVEVQQQFEKISGARLVEGYGLTETSPSTHCNPLTGERRGGSIGLPLPGTLCRIVDQDDVTREVPIGQPGELAIKGPQVFQGYWDREDTTGIFTDDGYLLTGDIATMDHDGYFAIVDRKKELIIAGGFNIYPSEVEEVLFRLSGVADAVVVGVPDPYRGETVKAFVVAAPGVTLTEADVIEHCRADLSAYKVPKLVEFRDELPRTVVGKVLRRVLVEQERRKAEQASEPVPASTPGGRPRPGVDAPVAAPVVVDATETSAPAADPDPRVDEPETVGRPVQENSVQENLVQKAPVKKAPVKKAPVKKAPVKKAVVAKPPVTKPPVPKPVVTKPPVTKAVATKAVVTKPPVTKAVATKAVVTGPRATKPPATKAVVEKAGVTKAVATTAPALTPSATKASPRKVSPRKAPGRSTAAHQASAPAPLATPSVPDAAIEVPEVPPVALEGSRATEPAPAVEPAPPTAPATPTASSTPTASMTPTASSTPTAPVPPVTRAPGTRAVRKAVPKVELAQTEPSTAPAKKASPRKSTPGPERSPRA